MLRADETVLVVIDVQERLLPAMWDQERLLGALDTLLQGAAVLELPVLCTEQVPAKLGPTVAPVAARLPGGTGRIEKQRFSGAEVPGFREPLEALERNTILLCGIETHVCVFQTARDLLALGYEVEVVSDAVSSRRERDWALGLRRVEAEGGRVTGVEMALLDMLGVAEGDRFRSMLNLIK